MMPPDSTPGVVCPVFIHPYMGKKKKFKVHETPKKFHKILLNDWDPLRVKTMTGLEDEY